MILPLTAGQHGLWFLCQSDARTSAAYNVVLAQTVDGELDVDLLRRAWTRLLERHPLLGARIAVADFEPRFVVDETPRVDVVTVDGDLAAVAHAASANALDLERGPLHRVSVVRDAGGRTSGLVIAIAHVVFDGGSVAPLMRELGQAWDALARGEQMRGDAAPPSQAALAEAEAAFLRSDAGRQRVAGLVQRLAGISALPVPPIAGRAGPGGAGVHEAATCEATLPEREVARVRQLAARERTTPAAVYLAAFEILVWQYAGQASFTVGVPTSLRDETTAGAVGYLANLGILRASIEPRQTVRAVIATASAQVLDLVDDARVPFPVLVRALKKAGEEAARLQPRLGFNCQPAPPLSLRLGSASLHAVGTTQAYAKDRLALDVEEGAQTSRIALLFDRASIDASTAADMLAQFTALLAQMCDDADLPAGRLARMTAARQAGLLAACNPPAGAPVLADADVVDLFERRARSTPGRPALVADGAHWNYGELHARAASLARALRDAGVRSEHAVAVRLPRGAQQVVALLANLMAGGVHVPVDLEQPADRLQALIADTRPIVLVTDGTLPHDPALAALPAIRLDALADTPADGREPAPARRAPGQLAYCIQTSGSTGRPKTVGVSAAALGRHVAACIGHYAMSADDRVLQVAASHLDPAIEQTLVALCSGACLHVRGQATWSPEDLVAAIATHGITVADVPTAYWKSYADTGFAALRPLPLRLLIIGGEAAPAATLPSPPLPFDWLNAYGPTEATITATTWRGGSGVDVGQPYLPIGRPLGHTRAYVLDEHLQPMPPGVRGELFLAGPQLARGYVGMPALTAASFLPDPFGPPGSRLYRTGDLARLGEDGQLEFLGRIDRQVKIRGFRVELGDVEAALHRVPGVQAAVVTPLADAAGATSALVAYVVAPGCTPADLRAQLALPDHMRPAHWVALDALPIGANGKVDRAALPAPASAQADAAGFAAPASELERSIAAVWCEVLQLDRVGLHDNFFALGGHSLLATQIIARLAERLGRAVKLRDLLDAPSVGALAGRLASDAGAAAVQRPRLVRQARTANAAS
ncbi:MAG TPA: amino acid adenylation domain-containing protein [Burkholderiaceae bacterium]